jgi:hypothetical protein
MKRSRVFAALAIATWFLAGGNQVFAQFSITITVDENANGTFSNTTGFFSPLPSAMQADPGPGGLSSALTYGLLNPPGLVAGDLLLVEPGAIGLISDIVRFNPNEVIAGTTGALVFYSDRGEGSDSLADVGFPTALYTNTASFVEVGPEGMNSFTYTPTAGMPGFIAGAAGPVSYVIKSDTTVPEPGTLTLCGIAMATSAGYGWIRRRRLIRETTPAPESTDF